MIIDKKTGLRFGVVLFFAGVIFRTEARMGYLSIGLISFSINFLFFPPAF